MNSNDFRSRGVPGYIPMSLESATEALANNALTVIPAGDEPIEEDHSFSLDKFQVVRREFFSHMSEPSITFSDYKIGLNTACIRRLPDIDYIQFLVNRQTQKLAIRPCLESDLHSFQWCTSSGGKRKPRQVTGRIFFMKLFDMMDWNPSYRYKILGKLIRANDEYLFIFDLTSTEVYQRIVKEGAKPKTSRTPVFPAEWQDQFGIPFEEHRKSLQINIFDNYAVYGAGRHSGSQHCIGHEKEPYSYSQAHSPYVGRPKADSAFVQPGRYGRCHRLPRERSAGRSGDPNQSQTLQTRRK